MDDLLDWTMGYGLWMEMETGGVDGLFWLV